MLIVNDIDKYTSDRASVVALGNFEGVHIGHSEILRSAANVAKEKGAVSICYTFSNHPGNIGLDIAGGDEPRVKLISTEDDKLARIEQLGIDICCNVPFGEKIMRTPAEDFIRKVLHDRLHASGVCCGFNYRFGDRAAGDVTMLESYGRDHGIEAIVHDPVTIDGEVVSSTAIRGLISEGNMEKCARFLGRPYSLSGVVESGNRLGRTIGFPTANFNAGSIMALPPNGVYFSRTNVDGEIFDSITNIGNKPTVGEYAKSIETHLLDFDGDLYGKNIMVELLCWERAERKFDSLDELKEEIASNTESARTYHEREKSMDKQAAL